MEAMLLVYNTVMIPKKIQDITLADIQQLVAGQVREGKTIEYKRSLSIATDSDKKEFLADASSFANTGGGDLLFGVDAKDGVATALTPLRIENIDAENLRIENILRSGIDPQSAFAIRPIVTAAPDEYVLLLRIHESWNKPHRVIYGGSGKFYARSSAGKYELDVEELREIFTLSDGIEKRIHDFRTARLFTIQTGDTVLPLTSQKLIVIHLLPLPSFSSKTTLPRDTLLALERETELFQPMSSSGWHSPRINLEGMFSFAGTRGESAHSYVQLFRNGVIELVESSTLDGRDIIPSKSYEYKIADGIQRAIGILKKVEVGTPIWICVSLLGVGGMSMSNSSCEGEFDDEHPIRQRDLILPATPYDAYGQDVGRILQPVFDLVWNACGLRKSRNYDNDGDFLIKG